MDRPNVTEGNYRTAEGGIARVRKSRNANRFYAERFNESTCRYQYEPGLVYNLVDRLPEQPELIPQTQSQPMPPRDISEGSYFTEDGKVARVRKSRSSDRIYAEKFNETILKFEYERGLVYRLGSRMTLDEARAWGARIGHCCVCGKRLTDNRSIDQGIGPVCITRI